MKLIKAIPFDDRNIADRAARVAERSGKYDKVTVTNKRPHLSTKFEYIVSCYVHDKSISIDIVNRAINRRFPKIFLVKGKGYYYIASDHQETALMLAGLYTTSMNVFKLRQLSPDAWVTEVEYLLKDIVPFNEPSDCVK